MKTSNCIILMLMALFLNISLKAQTVVKKLGISTGISEISSDVVDGKLFYYTQESSFKKNSQYYNIYYINIGDKQNDKSPKKIDSINSPFNDGPIFFDKENKKAYITHNIYTKKELKKEKLKKNLLGVKVYRFNEDNFTEEGSLDLSDTNISLTSLCYSDVTQNYYYITNKNKAKLTDIYYTTDLQEIENFQSKPLPGKSNSSQRENFIYLYKGIVFFASKRNQRFIPSEKYNIFYITELGLIHGERPKFLKELNSPFADDFGITFTDDENGYFTSNRNNVDLNYDIYKFKLKRAPISKNEFNLLLELKEDIYDSLQKEKVKIIDAETGVEKTSYAVKEGIFIEKLESGKEYNIETGDSEIELASNKIGPYQKDGESLLIHKKADLKFSKSVELISQNNDTIVLSEDLKKVIDMEGITLVNDQDNTDKNDNKNSKSNKGSKKSSEEKKNTGESVATLRFNNVLFELNKYIINANGKKELNGLVDYLQKHPNVSIEIYGHTDSRGATSLNKRLSSRRALETKNYLVSKGIDENRVIKTVGFGEEKLLNRCTNNVECSEEEHKLNRRVEVKLISPK